MRRFLATKQPTLALGTFLLVGSLPGMSRAAPPAPAKAAAPAACKASGGPCCDPAIAAHLQKDAIFAACGQSEASFLGEAGAKDTCTYSFNVPGAKPTEATVQIYAPAQKDVPTQPNDPFFKWKKVGKAFVTDKALSPKSAPMLINATGIWLPAKDHFVSVKLSTKVCTKAQVMKLAPKVK